MKPKTEPARRIHNQFYGVKVLFLWILIPFFLFMILLMEMKGSSPTQSPKIAFFLIALMFGIAAFRTLRYINQDGVGNFFALYTGKQFGGYLKRLLIVSGVFALFFFAISANGVFAFLVCFGWGILAYVRLESWLPEFGKEKPKPVPMQPQRDHVKEHQDWLDYNYQMVFPTYEKKWLLENDNHGSARFLSDSEKNSMLSWAAISQEENDFFPDGLYLGGGAWHQKQGNLLTIAPPRSGKGAAIIIPNLLLRKDESHEKMSFVVFDPKGTNARISGWSLTFKDFDVKIFDPFKMQEKMGPSSMVPGEAINIFGPDDYLTFNPLSFVDKLDTSLVASCKRIAGLICPDRPANPSIWDSEARSFIFSLILHVVTDPQYENEKNLVTVYKLFSEGNWENLFAAMEDNTAENGAVSSAAKRWRNLLQTAKETFGSTTFTVNSCLSWLEDPSIQAVMIENNYDPYELEKGGKAIFMCLPFDKTDDLKVFSRLFFGLSLLINGQPAPTPKKWVYYILDEFPSMGAFPEVIKGMAAYPEYNMRFWLFAQDLTQLDRIYTKNGRAEILSLCDVFQVFKSNDLETAKYASERLGDTTIKYDTVTYNESTSTGTNEGETLGQNGSSMSDGSSFGSSYSYTYNTTQMPRRLLTAEEVMKDDHIICFVKNVGNFRLKRSMYYQPVNKTDVTKGYYDYNEYDEKPISMMESMYSRAMQKDADSNPNY